MNNIDAIFNTLFCIHTWLFELNQMNLAILNPSLQIIFDKNNIKIKKQDISYTIDF